MCLLKRWKALVLAEEFLGLFVVTGFQAYNEMFEWLLALRLILLDP